MERVNLGGELISKADIEVGLINSHDIATENKNGFMSAIDKIKLDGIEAGANNIIVDSELNNESTNTVQNKVISDNLNVVFNQLKELNQNIYSYNKNIIADNITFTPDGNIVESDKYPIDFAYRHYVDVKNMSSNLGWFTVRLYKEDTLMQDFMVKIEGNAEHRFNIFNVNTTGVLGGWVENDKYFTSYNWYISVQSDNKLPAKFSIYNYQKDNPLQSSGILRNLITVDKSIKVGGFNDINSAIAYAKVKVDVLNNPVTIFIKNGSYVLNPVDSRNGVINKGANKISIIGESRDGVVITLNNTPAHNNKIIEHGGESTIANITFRNLWTEDGSTVSYKHNSYCVHNDLNYNNGGKRYKTVLKNCYLYSEVFAPVGAGLQNNQTQVYEDCVFEFNSLDERAGGYNQWAPLYVHAPASSSANNCALVVDNCTCIARKGTVALVLPNVAGSIPYSEIPTSIRRSIFVTNGTTVTEVNKINTALTTDCALNNVSSLNYETN